jgi:hypothetical protein
MLTTRRASTNSDEQNTINQNLFEDKQVELEHTIEALSKMLDDWVAQDDNGSQTLSDQTRQQTLGLMDVSLARHAHIELRLAFRSGMTTCEGLGKSARWHRVDACGFCMCGRN